MARRSTRIASSQGSQASSSPPAPSNASPSGATKKRKAEPGESPSAKRGKKVPKAQKTIEESMDVDNDESEKPQATPTAPSNNEEPKEADHSNQESEKHAPEQSNGNANGQSHAQEDSQKDPSKELDQEAGAASAAPDEADTETKSKPETSDDKDNATGNDQPTESDESKPAANGDNAVEDGARDDKVPSSIMEKGVIYFFFRGRVNVEDPKNVQDLQRSFFVLRPLPTGAKIGDGSIGDEKNCRLIAIPKKMLPLSGDDKWTAFVETANVSFKELKESFLKSDQYETQTGPRTTPAATPFAEGVYAITSTGRESHLAYILTLPEKLGDIQNDLGLRQRGSFVVSVKNPKAPGPSNADLGKDPGYSQEILNTFRGLRWSPLQPEMLNYEACQFLLIGEGEKGLDKATETQPGDEKKDETAKEEIEKLEEEDELRVQHLNGEDAVFADLGTNAKDYNGLETTW